MRIQPNCLAILNVLLFTVTISLGIASCNTTQQMDQKDKGKDISEVQNDVRFKDSSNAQSDADFLVQAALINIHAIGIARLGNDKSKMPEILVLSKMLIKDHTLASEQLKLLADKKSILLPVSAENNEDEGINKLVNEKNATFDKVYTDVIIQYHMEAIEKFEAANAVTKDDAVKSYIISILPKLKEHLEHAKQIQTAIK